MRVDRAAPFPVGSAPGASPLLSLFGLSCGWLPHITAPPPASSACKTSSTPAHGQSLAQALDLSPSLCLLLPCRRQARALWAPPLPMGSCCPQCPLMSRVGPPRMTPYSCLLCPLYLLLPFLLLSGRFLHSSLAPDISVSVVTCRILKCLHGSLTHFPGVLFLF